MLMDEWVDGWVGEGSSCVNTDVLEALQHSMACPLYSSDAADHERGVDFGPRRVLTILKS